LIREKVGAFYGVKQKTLKLDIVVVRINKFGYTCNARPCYYCLNMMNMVGIRKVYYSVSPTKIICESVKDMVSIEISSVYKYIEKLNGNIYVDEPIKYYEHLLKKLFPSIIKKYNLEQFINYNLVNVLPNHKIIIQTNTVLILNTDNEIIIKSKIIN